MHSIFPNLTQPIVKLDDFRRFLSNVRKSINQYHAHFAGTNAEIEVFNGSNMVSISKDYICVAENQSVELHWMENLNGKSVRKVLNENGNRICELKLINNSCAEASVDISSFATNSNYDEIDYLDIKSVGPISVKANVS